MLKKMKLIVLLGVGFICSIPLWADEIGDLKKEIDNIRGEYEEKMQKLQVQIEALSKNQEEKNAVLAQEVSRLKEKGEEREGLGEKIHFHGYGELHYNNTSEEAKNDKMDFHRMVLGWTYPFSDNIVLDGEIDFEHAASEIELEYAKIDFLLNPAINLRMGSLLMPVGYLNEYHEPTHFFSVERPYVQKDVIPTTWQEGGVGIFGALFSSLNYRIYLVSGLEAARFTAGSGIRSGRLKVQDAKADDLAVVGRLEYSGVQGASFGFSGYSGDSAQKNSSLSGADAGVSIIEGDARYRFKDLEFTGLAAKINIDDTDKINTATGRVIGKEIFGWYVEAGYHIGRLFLPGKQDLVVFVRREEYNTQDKVAAGWTGSAANDRRVTTSGLAYYPLENVAVKTDVESWENEAGAKWHHVNVGFGYEF